MTAKAWHYSIQGDDLNHRDVAELARLSGGQRQRDRPARRGVEERQLQHGLSGGGDRRERRGGRDPVLVAFQPLARRQCPGVGSTWTAGSTASRGS